jgi:hypothetical protein
MALSGGMKHGNFCNLVNAFSKPMMLSFSRVFDIIREGWRLIQHLRIIDTLCFTHVDGFESHLNWREKYTLLHNREEARARWRIRDVFTRFHIG